MAWRILQQPNGLLARFSDIVDGFTHYNMHEQEAVNFCIEKLGKAAIKKPIERPGKKL